MLAAKFGKVFNFSFPYGMKNRWYKFNKKEGNLERVADSAEDTTKATLLKVVAGEVKDKKTVQGFTKRKMVARKKVVSFQATKGANFQLEFKEPKADLTHQMLVDGSWKEEEFNFNVNGSVKGKEIPVGGQHPLLRVRTQFRHILLEMGFNETPTNNFVESSFWNFDSLFQPQQHPARDAHDTFFIKEPSHC